MTIRFTYQFRCNYFTKESLNSAVDPTGESSSSSSSVVFEVRSILRLGVVGGNPMTEFLEEKDWREKRNSSMEVPWSMEDGLMMDDGDANLKLCETLTLLRVPKVHHPSIVHRIHLHAPAGFHIGGNAPNMMVHIFEVTHITLPLIDEQGIAIYPEDGDYPIIDYPFRTEEEEKICEAKFLRSLKEYVVVVEDTNKEDEDACIDNWWRKLCDAVKRIAFPVTREAEVGHEEERTCPICIEVLEPDKAWSKMPCCPQVFHCGCISKWTKRVKKCPWCRSPLPLVLQSAKGFAHMTQFRPFLTSKLSRAS